MLLPPSQAGGFHVSAKESWPILSTAGNFGGSGRSRRKNYLTLQTTICIKTTCRMTSIMTSVTRNYKYIFYSALLVIN